MKVTSDDLKSLYQEWTAHPDDGRIDCLTAETMMNAATGRLSEEERARVADHLATCSDCAWEFRFVRAHKTWAEEAGQAFAAAEPGLHSPGAHPADSTTRPALRQRLASVLWAGRTPIAITAQLLLLALLALGGWLILSRDKTESQIDLLNEQLAARDRALEAANRSLDETRRQLEEAIRSRDQALTAVNKKQYEEEIARLRQTIVDLTGPQLEIPIIDLESIRGGATGTPLSLELPGYANLITLVLHFNDRQQHTGYEVEIYDQRDSQVWRGQSKGRGNKLNLTFPRRFFSEGRYLIRLFGLKNEKKNLVADFAVTISFR
jgi:hypothetical protein